MMKEPKDLKVKIGSRKQSLWLTVIKNLEDKIKCQEEEFIVQRAFLQTAKLKEKEEELKFKRT